MNASYNHEENTSWNARRTRVGMRGDFTRSICASKVVVCVCVCHLILVIFFDPSAGHVYRPSAALRAQFPAGSFFVTKDSRGGIGHFCVFCDTFPRVHGCHVSRSYWSVSRAFSEPSNGAQQTPGGP